MKVQIINILADSGMTIGEASDLLRGLASEIMVPVYEGTDVLLKTKLTRAEG